MRAALGLTIACSVLLAATAERSLLQTPDLFEPIDALLNSTDFNSLLSDVEANPLAVAVGTGVAIAAGKICTPGSYLLALFMSLADSSTRRSACMEKFDASRKCQLTNTPNISRPSSCECQKVLNKR